MSKKRGFLNIVVSPTLLVWLAQLIFGGMVQAVVAFFIKKKLEKSEETNKNG